MRESIDDLSALAWVHDELRRSLESAHKALRRHLKEADALGQSDVDAVDPAILRSAKVQFHQGVGALELVGLRAAATVLRASEAAVVRFTSRPDSLTLPAIEDVERASFALLDYLSRMLAGKPVSPLSLFPQYRAVQEVAGSPRAHPADLWSVDWRWTELPASSVAVPRRPDAATRELFENELLKLVRDDKPLKSAARMSELCAGLGAGAERMPVATLWKLASAVFEAQARGLLPVDVFSKRVAARLLAQFRALERNDSEVSDRLAQDLLFFCAQSAEPSEGHKAHRLTAARNAYGLATHKPVDYSRSALGQFDPAWIAQARKRVAAAKESWSAVAGGEMHRLAGLTEQFSLVGDSLKRLFPQGETLATELLRSVGPSQSSGQAPPAPLAMEVATSLLYVDAVLEDAEFNHPEQSARVQRLAERLASVRGGEPPDALEAWMEELYRRVADRQTMGSVVQELRASLSDAEKLIDEFFRNPSEPKSLLQVPRHLAAMRGVLSVLGMDHAASALLRMRDDVDGLSSTAIDPERVAQAGVFDRIAGNLGALGFLIDMLSVQPQMAKLLFAYDAATGNLNPVMGRTAGRQEEVAAPAEPVPLIEARLLEQAQNLAISALHQHVPVADVARDLEQLSHEALAADQVGLAETMRDARTALGQARTEADIDSVRGKLSEALIDFVSSVSDTVTLEPETAVARNEPVAAPVTLAKGRVALDEGDELRNVFLEEAREVLDAAEAARQALTVDADEVAQLTAVRRAFHTLKGSSRMVGLKDFGEGSWICERIYNTQLADQHPADSPLLEFTQWALEYLRAWISDIAAHRLGGHSSATVAAAAQLLSDRRDEAGSQQLSDIDLPLPALPPTAAVAAIHPSDGTKRVIPPEIQAVDGKAPEGQATEPQASELEVPPSFELPSLFGTLGSEAAELDTTELPSLLDGVSLSTEGPEARANGSPGLPPHDLPELTDAVSDLGGDNLPVLTSEVAEPENFKVVGPLRIGIPLFNIYLNEADELSRRLTTELAEWAMELHRPIGEAAIATAHSLAGSSATVGFTDLSDLSRTLEHALTRSEAIGQGTPDEARLFVDCAEEIRRMLHQFAAGFLVSATPSLLSRLAEHEISSARRLEAATAASDMPASTRGADLSPLPLEPLLHIRDVGKPDAPATTGESTAEPPEFASDLGELQDQPPQTAAVDTDFTALRSPPQAFEASGFVDFRPLPEHLDHMPRSAPVSHTRIDFDDDIDAVDVMDAELFPIFEEEALELLPLLAGHLRDWVREPARPGPASACMRVLHTLKGGARLAGAMRLGEMAHRLETRIEHLAGDSGSSLGDIEALQAGCDALVQVFDGMRSRDAQAHADAAAAITDEIVTPPQTPHKGAGDLSLDAQPAIEIPAPAPVAPPVRTPSPAPSLPDEAGANDPPGIDWSKFAISGVRARVVPDRRHAAPQSAVRVRAPLLDRLVNQAGEVSITRSRIETEVGQIKGSLTDLTDNLERLRLQLRDIELQAEMQMSSRLEAAKAADQSFDPLEFDRFTRFQEVTRMMAESVNDVATVQRTLQRALESTEDELAAQARMTRELQDDLLRTRMVEFEQLSDRFYRVVRQAAKETGKQVRLDITGGAIEVDRGVLDRMTGTFEHLLRNCITHGIEIPQVRSDAGKDPTGSIVVILSQEGNEVGVEFRDDGAGLNLGRIRAKGEAMGLIDPKLQYSDADLANLIFTPGFSTAENVTELAGRGIGMDVVRSEVNGIGGRVETSTAPGQGTSFKLVLPLTTAVTQVVMLRCGTTTVAVPSTLIEIVRRTTPAEIEHAYASGVFKLAERTMPFFWLGALLQIGP
ncbi:MAG: Hpt domain-containing protein, partial [Rhizobacter sp.]|nr:Hpt domain-containing protein [Rhizobacter sp.]